jgi:hypothetical protein
MMSIKKNRVIIEFPDLCGFEEDIICRLPTELSKLLQCATILQVEHGWETDTTFYSIYSLLNAIHPTMPQVQALHFNTTNKQDQDL